MGYKLLTSARQTQTSICVKFDFQPFRNSNGILRTNLVGTLSTIYCCLKASLYIDMGSLELSSILLTMSIKVWFLFSATLFGHSKPSIVLSYNTTILKKLRRWTWCLSDSHVPTIMYSSSI